MKKQGPIHDCIGVRKATDFLPSTDYIPQTSLSLQPPQNFFGGRGNLLRVPIVCKTPENGKRMKENQPVSTATDVLTNKTNRLGAENFFVPAILAEERQELEDVL